MSTSAVPDGRGSGRVSGSRRRVSSPRLTFASLELADLDLRSTRDLSGRRLWKGRIRQLGRVATLLTGDIIVFTVASWIALRAMGLTTDAWLSWFPRVITVGLFGQSTARTYSSGRGRARLANVAFGGLLMGGSLAVLDAFYGPLQAVAKERVVLTAAVIAGLCTWRLLLAMSLRLAYAHSIGCRRILIVGDRDHANDVIGRFESAREPHVKVLGYVDSERPHGTDALGSVHEINRLIEEKNVDAVVISAHLPPLVFGRVVKACFLHAVAVTVVPWTLTEIPSRVSSRELLGMPLLELEPPRLHTLQVTAKRMTDIAIGSLLLVLLSPLLLLVALAVRLDSPGPIFFSQSRSGLGGKWFRMLKFRTMSADAEQVLHADPALYERYVKNDYKLPADEDPRIRPLGRFLRASSLDELPQLFNVLRGDMSLIGPRPVVAPELGHYGEWSRVVLGVRPGMTGWWQVAGRSKIQYPERAHLDIYYVTHWSLALDLKILFMTLPAVFRRSGAF